MPRDVQSPASIARAPRPWISRETGECAFPVAEAGRATLSCCNPASGAAYCAEHLARMRGPVTASMERLIASLAAIADEAP
jgi:hypothetical protein